MKRFPLHLLLTLFLVLPLAACDSDDDDDNGNGNGNGDVGNASVTVSGDISATFSGNAFFFVDEDDDDVDFAIGLFSGAITNPTAGQIVGLGRDGDRPATGTYTIDAEGDNTVFSGGYANFEGTGGDPTGATLVSAQTGTVTITSSSNDRVVGSFTFTGQVFSGTGDTGGTATVEGTFTAERVEEGNVPIFP